MTGTDFGQEIRLTTRLHDLVRSYPRGISIISEFIQNADDAESSSLTVLLDTSTYTGDRLDDQRMRALLGPALLVQNESVFSESDFESIKRIGESSKAESGPKTGRFGVGFNTCYNVTDFPSFVSGHDVVCFDPHFTAVADPGRSPGKRWTLKDAWSSSPDWMRSFSAAGLKEDAAYYPGTIFRFPLRTAEQASQSEIWKEPFTVDDYIRIVQQLSEDGPQLLLFTKYLTRLTARIVDGSNSEVLEIKTSNNGAVVQARDALLRSLQLDLKDGLKRWKSAGNLPIASYEHCFDVTHNAIERSENWHVVNGLFTGPDGCLLDAAAKMISIGEKALPLAGAAVRTNSQGSAQGSFKGKVYCGLPLPLESEIPVHINGYFDLDSSRHALSTGESIFGQNEYRISWNKLLMQHGAAAAYARLLVDTRQKYQNNNTELFYSLFPSTAVDSSLFALLSKGLYSKLAQQPVIRTTSQGNTSWRTLSSAYDCDTSVREALIADGKPILDPLLPFHIVHGFTTCGIASKQITPKALADDLRVSKDVNCVFANAPRRSLTRREWVTALLKFCLQDTSCQLKGLPLAIALDGKLHTFGYTRGGVLFHATTGIQKQLFTSDHDWFIDEQFLKDTSVRYQSGSGFRAMTTADVVSRAGEKLRSIQGGDRIQKDAFPNEDWLTTLFKYLSSSRQEELATQRAALSAINLVPDANLRLRPLGSPTTPLLRSSEKEHAALIAACEKLGVPFVTAGPKLTEAIHQFALAHLNLLFPLSPNRIVPLFSKVLVETTSYDAKIHDPILSYLSRSEILDLLVPQTVSILAELKILPTQSKSLARATEENVFFPPDYRPPKSVRNVRLLQTGPHGSWGNLYERLAVRHLDRVTLILDVILPHFGGMTESDQLESMEWVRDCFEEEYGRLQNSDPQLAGRFKHALSHTPIIICTDGKLHSPNETYDPQESVISQVLGPVAVLPDTTKYKHFPDSWASFFHRIGMVVWPRAADLLRYIDQVTTAYPTEKDSAEQKLFAIFDFIQKHWERYKEAKVSVASGNSLFSEALTSRAWLPAVRNLRSGASPTFIRPTERLYKPSELYPTQQANWVGRIHPLFGRNVDRHFRDAIRMPVRPVPNDVSRQFDELLATFHSDSKAFGGHQRAAAIFNEIYRYFGDIKSSESEVTSTLLKQLRSRYEDQPCILDPSELRLWEPSKTFSDSVPHLKPFRAQITSSDNRLSAGLDALGRNSSPELRHLIDFLKDYKDHFEDKKLSAAETEQVIFVLQMVQRSGQQSFPKDLPLLTTASTLVPADRAVWQDTERYRDRLSDQAPSIVDPRLLSIAVSLRVPKMTEVFVERLTAARTQDKSLLSKSFTIFLNRVRSAPFAAGLRRIVRQKYEVDLASATLEALKNIQLQPCVSVETQIIYTPDDRVVGEGPCAWFYESAENCVYISATLERQIRVALSRAIAIRLEPLSVDPMQIDSMLAEEPSEIAAVLDAYDIPPLEEESSVTETVVDDAPPDLADVGGPPDLGFEDAVSESSEVDESPIAEEQTSTPSVTAEDTDIPISTETSETQTPAVADEPFTSAPEAKRSPYARPMREQGDYRPKSPGYGADDTPPSMPSSPTEGTRTRGEGQTHEPRHHVSSPKRFSQIVTYVISSKAQTGDGSLPIENDPENIAISQAAVDHVIQAEIRAQRVPEEMNFTNPGFDVKSYDPVSGSTRYIEVKGTDGEWDKMGVHLTPTQFEFARTKGSEFWLYVVENARSEQPALFCFQNPFSQVDQYRFDGGWKGLANEAAADAEVEPQHFALGVHVSLQDPESGERRGIVEEIETSGAIKRFTIRLTDGTKVKKCLDASLKVVSE